MYFFLFGRGYDWLFWGGGCFDVMYVEWCGVCDFVVVSAVEVFVDYCGVYVL